MSEESTKGDLMPHCDEHDRSAWRWAASSVLISISWVALSLWLKVAPIWLCLQFAILGYNFRGFLELLVANPDDGPRRRACRHRRAVSELDGRRECRAQVAEWARGRLRDETDPVTRSVLQRYSDPDYDAQREAEAATVRKRESTEHTLPLR